MWAARRIELYYALINTHLSAAEAADIVENSGAKVVIGSRATRRVCDGIGEYLAEKPPTLQLIAGDDAHGWQRYPECVADQPSTPGANDREGGLLQYLSGTAGRPKGIVRQLPHIVLAEAPLLPTPLSDKLDVTADSVYLSPMPLYHNAYPDEVERLLGSHPSVVEVAVLGVPEEQYGQRLAAFAVLVVCLHLIWRRLSYDSTPAGAAAGT